VTDQVPAEVIAGDTWSWTRSFADYPAGTWALTYYFENKDGVFQATATPSGIDHAVTILASTTAGYKAGSYRWSARLSSAGVSITLETGWIKVKTDPAAAGKADPRGWARRTLEAIEAFLEGNATTAQAAMTLNGRSISRWSLNDLIAWRDKLRAEVRTEESSTSGTGRTIKLRMSRG